MIAIVIDSPAEWNVKKGVFFSGEEELLFKALANATGLNQSDYKVYYAVNQVVGPKPSLSQAQMLDAHIELHNRFKEDDITKALLMGPTAYNVAYLRNVTNVIKIRGLGEICEGPTHSVYTVVTVPLWYVTKKAERFRDLAYDFEKVIRTDKPFERPQISTKILRDPEKIDILLDMMRGAEFISCDLETTGLDPLTTVIDAIGFGTFSKGVAKTFVIPHELVYHPKVVAALYGFFLSWPAPIVFHNAKFDVKYLTHYFRTNIDPHATLLYANIHDTLLMNYLLDERPINSEFSSHGLKTQSRIRYDEPDYKFDFEEFWRIPREFRDYTPMYKYLALDLMFTCLLYIDLKKEHDEESPKFASLCRDLLFPATKALAEIEYVGIPIDKEYLQQYGIQLEQRLEEIRANIRQFMHDVGIADLGAHFSEQFNPGSPKQVGELLYDILKLPAGKERSTDEDTLERLKLTVAGKQYIPLMEQILEYRQTNKFLGTYVHGIVEKLDQNNRLHGSFNIPGTSTGRLSSEDPNLQNIPQMAGPQIRRAFIAPPGWKWVKFDYSQLEYRSAAHLCEDPFMLQLFADGQRDIHREVAAGIYGIDPRTVDKEQRYAAKFVGFGLIYQRGAESIAHGPELRAQGGWTTQKAQKFIDDFLKQFPGLDEYIKKIKKLVVSEQELETELGRKRRWPYLNNRERANAQRAGVNFPIQSTASDITLYALTRLHMAYQGREDIYIVAIVHDEIDFLMREEIVEKESRNILNIMQSGHLIPLKVKVVAEAQIGENWGSLEDYNPDKETWWIFGDASHVFNIVGEIPADIYATCSGPFNTETEALGILAKRQEINDGDENDQALGYKFMES